MDAENRMGRRLQIRSERIAKRKRLSGIAHTSLFRKYFSFCSLCVIASITVLGVMLLAFAYRYFEQDKYSMMERYVRNASKLTAEDYIRNNRTGVVDMSLIYTAFSHAIGAEVYLTNLSGDIIHYENAGVDVDQEEPLVLNSDQVAPQVIRQVLQKGIYKETGYLHGLHSQARYVVGLPIMADGRAIGIIFAACPATDWMDFLINLFKMFLFSSFIVLAIAFVFIYFITSSMVKPLKQMVDATHSFSQGDFSKRVPVSDYDEIGQLSMAFNNMASTLATTESSRRSFVANVSHELKTPMTTIGGFVDGILDGTVPPDKRDQYLQVVSTEVKRLSRLVRSMLDTARIEAGEMEIRPTLFDISELARQTVFTFEQTIEEKELEIRGLDGEKVMVMADKDLLHQVIYNLCENAVKFVNQGGYIEFSYRQDQKMTYVGIRNSGEGIEKEEVPQLFDRFYKSDKSRSLNKGGVGLGLHIVRSILNYHKGEIVVRSVKGEYTEFEFAIPNPSS